jgi:hypothetical protein
MRLRRKAVTPLAGPQGQIRGRVEGEPDSDFLTEFDDLAGRFLSGRDEEFDLADVELLVEVFGVEGEDLFDDLQDGRGHERRALGSLFDPSAEEVVERLGVEAF